MKTLGRIDWKPRPKVWRVIWYVNGGEIAVGDYPTQTVAAEVLQIRIKEMRR